MRSSTSVAYSRGRLVLVLGGTLLLMWFVLVPLVDSVVVYLAYGGDAFEGGLRVTNWHTGELTDGSRIMASWETPRFVLHCLAMIVAFSALKLTLGLRFDKHAPSSAPSSGID